MAIENTLHDDSNGRHNHKISFLALKVEVDIFFNFIQTNDFIKTRRRQHYIKIRNTPLKITKKGGSRSDYPHFQWKREGGSRTSGPTTPSDYPPTRGVIGGVVGPPTQKTDFYISEILKVSSVDKVDFAYLEPQ